MSKIAVMSEFWEFMRARRKYWLIPVVAVLVLMGLLIALTEGSVVAPFIYTLF